MVALQVDDRFARHGMNFDSTTTHVE
jgi:hypothetical protein